MTDEETSCGRENRIRFFASFFSVLVRPARTMRLILSHPRDPWMIPLVLLAMVASSLDGLDIEGLKEAFGTLSPVVSVLIVIGVLLLAVAITLGLFFGLAYVATLVGRHFLEGTGTARDLRSALAWGFAPLIVAMFYEVPAFVFWGIGATSKTMLEVSGETIAWEPGLVTRGGCWKMLILAVLDVVFFGWYLVVSSWTVGEAHRFSAWRGLACLLISWVSPVAAILVIAIAAAMS